MQQPILARPQFHLTQYMEPSNPGLRVRAKSASVNIQVNNGTYLIELTYQNEASDILFPWMSSTYDKVSRRSKVKLD